jgi:hypothetical protein
MVDAMVNAYVENCMKYILVNHDYANLNASSIASVYATAIGCNGARAKELGNTILDNYLAWSRSSGDQALAQFVADVIKSKDRALASNIKYQMGSYGSIDPEPDDYPRG